MRRIETRNCGVRRKPHPLFSLRDFFSVFHDAAAEATPLRVNVAEADRLAVPGVRAGGMRREKKHRRGNAGYFDPDLFIALDRFSAHKAVRRQLTSGHETAGALWETGEKVPAVFFPIRILSNRIGGYVEMTTGRKPLGPRLAENLDASEIARKRLRIILETLSGEKNIEQACRELGISQPMFFKMRNVFLDESVELLEPRAPGRKKHELSPDEIRLRELEEENLDLRLKLEAEMVKTEIALVMPHLLKNPVQKKTTVRKRGKTNTRKTADGETCEFPQADI